MDVERRRRGKQPAVTDEQIQAFLDKGLNGSAIARQVGLTPQAISLRIKRLRADEADKQNYRLPWSVRVAHTTGYVYRAVVAYAKYRRGEPLTERERQERVQLEEYLHREEAVVTYDYNRGFMLRGRRPSDGPSHLA